MNARVILRDENERNTFVESFEMDRNEILVETRDRYAPDHALLMHPTCQDAIVVAKQHPELNAEGDKGYTEQRMYYVVRGPEAMKILMSQSGAIDVTRSRCYVLRSGA